VGIVDLPRIEHFMGFEAILCPDEDFWVGIDKGESQHVFSYFEGKASNVLLDALL
jgi:hypothetical protein